MKEYEYNAYFCTSLFKNLMKKSPLFLFCSLQAASHLLAQLPYTIRLVARSRCPRPSNGSLWKKKYPYAGHRTVPDWSASLAVNEALHGVPERLCHRFSPSYRHGRHL
jgi:hypothetical protein